VSETSLLKPKFSIHEKRGKMRYKGRWREKQEGKITKEIKWSVTAQ
jgi:hypothetical protein